MLSLLAGALRLASLALCLIVVTSFALFVVNQTGSASAHQQEELNGPTITTAAPAQGGPPATAHRDKSTLRSRIDEVAKAVTSPFSAVTNGSSSQWVIRGVGLLLALLVYGFGLGFLARVIRVRL